MKILKITAGILSIIVPLLILYIYITLDNPNGKINHASSINESKLNKVLVNQYNIVYNGKILKDKAWSEYGWYYSGIFNKKNVNKNIVLYINTVELDKINQIKNEHILESQDKNNQILNAYYSHNQILILGTNKDSDSIILNYNGNKFLLLKL